MEGITVNNVPLTQVLEQNSESVQNQTVINPFIEQVKEISKILPRNHIKAKYDKKEEVKVTQPWTTHYNRDLMGTRYISLKQAEQIIEILSADEVGSEDIAYQLSISKPYASSILKSLQLNLPWDVQVKTIMTGKRGRPKLKYRINPKSEKSVLTSKLLEILS